MLHWLPRSILGVILAVVYVVFAIIVIFQDRREKGGDWISLHGMISFLVTMPVSAPMEWMGAKLNFRKNLDMAFAVSVCACLVYLVGAGIGKLAMMMLR